MKKIYLIFIILAIIWSSIISIAISAGSSVIVGIILIFAIYLYQNKEEKIYGIIEINDIKYIQSLKTIKPANVAIYNLRDQLGLGNRNSREKTKWV